MESAKISHFLDKYQDKLSRNLDSTKIKISVISDSDYDLEQAA